MNISKAGIDLIKRFEGFHKKLPDGRCAAYQDTFVDKKTGKTHTDVATCGWGCTEGVSIGTVWTPAEADDALRRELAKHEQAVTLAVTVPINANEFDSLVSFSFNVGAGAMRKSRIITALNAGDRVVAANAFLLYNRAGGIVVDGLTSRRMREAANFLKPTAAPIEPQMPQTVDPPKRPISTQEKVVAGAVAGSAVLETTKSVVGKAQEVKQVAHDASELVPLQPLAVYAAKSIPLIGAGLIFVCGVALLIAHFKRS